MVPPNDLPYPEVMTSETERERIIDDGFSRQRPGTTSRSIEHKIPAIDHRSVTRSISRQEEILPFFPGE
jgi:hypothetical protein